VIINDRADIARLAGADGVHLGQDDLPPPSVRALVGAAAELGLSTHTIEQIERAVLEPVSYVAVGPVFGTVTKATGYEPIGLEIVREAAARTRARGLPLVAIGGITLENAVSVLDAGAASVAVISDLLAAGNPEERVRAFVERLSPYQRPRV
jgi:thiamine-phosphate pyrophosphorylase